MLQSVLHALVAGTGAGLGGVVGGYIGYRRAQRDIERRRHDPPAKRR